MCDFDLPSFDSYAFHLKLKWTMNFPGEIAKKCLYVCIGILLHSTSEMFTVLVSEDN